MSAREDCIIDTEILERTWGQQAIDIAKLRRVAELWDDLDTEF